MDRTYMKQLDGLRAFAVLFTMVTHFTRSQEGLLGHCQLGACACGGAVVSRLISIVN
jgi:peptidoglycan/LPS O-acetylase OafA/YrhL